MLSQGQWHKHVPTDPIANVKFRIKLYKACAKDRTLRRGVEAICQQDILFFINVFVWQYNPRLKGWAAIGPFICWDFQAAAFLDRPETTGRYGLLWAYEHNRTSVIEKSRDMGASWIFLIFQVWLCLFHPYVQCLDISKNERAVDDKSPDSLFWKIRFIHEWLPPWLAGEIDDNNLFFQYKKSKSHITGEASTGRAGVGGRASLIFIDEFSQIREDKQVRQRTASTSDCRFFNGTHNGVGSEFFKLTQTPEICKIQMHWSQHPEKRAGLYRWNHAKNKVDILDTQYEFPHDYQFVTDGSPHGGPYPGLRSTWYDKKCGEIGNPRAVAEELDINPTGSVSQFFEPFVIQKLQLEYACPPFWEGDIVRETPSAPFQLVREEGGPFKLWTYPDVNGKLPAGVYKIGGDLSWGLGATNSCLSIGNADTGERIGEYVTPFVEPRPLAAMAVWLCRHLVDSFANPAELIWEIPGPGLAFGKEVLELGYRNIFWNENDLKQFVTGPKTTPGWMSEYKAKMILLDEYRAAIKSKHCLNRCKEALEECLLFQYSADGAKVFHSGSLETDDPSGAGVNHGDRVIADALMWRLMKGQANENRKKEENPGPPLLSLEWRRNWRHQQERRQRAW